ncbi:transmembrane protein 94 isoform X1 [Scleropages formosus]|uniref:Transmembrane protein 94 n=1 Tax=Scleropages formosus TaxID=113540 RepID=A0A8C9T5Y1_SCLFO|nr:transmembrane protein 94 isoform X1 [Scleropages formosus]XP_029102577.1 transmembrane protein 94 isoform X1 [Scleropages formosus]XP_029102578.1 transmembrane protein 94 isoform X1 [Scleropages formosus]XP_029102579.1 transmembrane protein 94 isoform X1 [Scleropages formosus]
MELQDRKREEEADALGLSTSQALSTLRDQLSALLLQQQQKRSRRRPTLQELWAKSFLHHNNRHSSFHWPGVAFTLLVVFGLLCCHGSQPKGSQGIELVNACALFLLLLLNLFLIGRQERLKKSEMVRRLKSIISQLDNTLQASAGEPIKWSASLYPDLYTPSSPSWSLHWTYRDNQLVNLPVSLLVEGDIIALRPGQESFASLRGIKDDEHIVLEPGDLFPPFSPPPSPRVNEKRGPQSPQQFRLFRVVRTPILDSIRNSLDLALSRPVTALDNERFTVQSIMAKFACPVVLVAFLVVNTARYFFSAPSLAESPVRFTFFQLQVMGVLPILPLLFPVMWVVVNAYGEARVLAESNRASPTGLLAKFSEDTLSSYTEVVSSQELLRCVWRHFVSVLRGESQTLCYTSSLLHSLGSVTVLCCVDKQGVLSWPNPSPETVLFFSGRVELPHNSQDDLRDDLSVGSFCRMEGDEDRDEAQEGEALLSLPAMESSHHVGNEHEPSETSHDTARSSDTLRLQRHIQPTRTKHPSGSNVSFSHDTEGGEEDPIQSCGAEASCCEAEDFVCDYHLEMLSLSQDQQNPVSIQFDDSGWQGHLPSLKPLGLNILLNLCNAGVTQQLCRFSDHLSNLALQESHGIVQAVHVPWGLCELSRLIGFTPGARELFKQENHLTLYQLPSGEKAKETAPRRLHNLSKRQPPISHLISLLVRDSTTNNVQMLSHGSADLILEACTDFWDGSDIYPLSGSDRKKVLDFYQRACLSGYCSAFAYKPMQVSLSPQLNGKCVELAPGPTLFSGVELPSTTPIKHGSRRNSWSSDEGIGEVVEREDCVQALSGQIFMGMVSSQFQARLDTVRLIDALVNACIRFVYFSMEDELRSKVFAEKMGLETGWNCHISLTPNGDGNCDMPPSSPSHAGSLHDDLHQDSRDEAEGPLLPEDEGHSDLASFQPTDSDVPSFLEDCNRAKLPRGIHQVRPHLKNIDNVPLLVPLFTDCTPETMCEMMKIMQENREVTCCLGSSANFRNSCLFLQSDLSIALDPLYPSRCSWETFGYAASSGMSDEAGGLSPLELSGRLNTLGCSVTFHQGESVSIVKLIEQARHTTYGIRKCFLFLLQCQLTLVIIQFLACLAQLPPPMNITDILWLSCFCYPLLSVSLLGKPPDSSVMTVATGKNLESIPRKTQHYFLGCFLLKFSITVCAYLLGFGFSLQAVCGRRNSTINCFNVFATSSSPDAPHWFTELSNGLLLIQKVMAGFLALHTVVISLSYVHRSQSLWRRSPFSNTWWCLTVPVVLLGQVLQAIVDFQLWQDRSARGTVALKDIPIEVWLLVSLSPLLVVLVNEAVKLHEIRVRVRYQKRQKLQFETKLGMNSPF